MSTAAGWYDDGSGRQRWWDGEAWTEQFADQQAVTASATSSGGLLSAMKGATSAVKKAAGIGSTAAASSTEVLVAEDAVEEVPLYQVTSHIDGAKNAKVRLYQDRIEWERGRGVSGAKVTAGLLTGGLSLLATGVKGGKDAFEMLPLQQITSVSNRKDGMLYHLVEVQTAGGTVAFRVSRDDAATFRQAILTQIQVRATTPVAVQVTTATVVEAAPAAAAAATPDYMAQLQQLAQLRDAGILTDDEFAAKKEEILSRM